LISELLLKNATGGRFVGQKYMHFFALRGLILCLFVSSFFGVTAWSAADFGTAGVLPKGRFQAVVRFGNVQDIQNKYNDSGTLQSPSRMNVRLDNNFLRNNSAEMRKALDLINSIDPGTGNQVDLGELNITGQADVNYIAPQLAYGMTSRWTLGVAIPIVNLRSDVHFENRGVNTASAVFNRVGDIAQAKPEMQAQMEMIKQGPEATVNGVLQQQGFKKVSARDQTFMGDIVIGSSIKLYESRYWSFFLLNNLNLPTGPADDPDDLVDLNIFGKTNLANTLYANLDVNYWLQFGFGVGYVLGIPDHVTKRVPRSEGDFAPPENTKEKLSRDPGDTYNIQATSIVKLSDIWELGGGYEFGYKTQDRYRSGNQTARYDLLEKNTDQNYQIARFKVSYTTVSSYLGGKSKIPFIVTYAVSDIFAGKNIERQLNNEVLLKLFF